MKTGHRKIVIGGPDLLSPNERKAILELGTEIQKLTEQMRKANEPFIARLDKLTKQWREIVGFNDLSVSWEEQTGEAYLDSAQEWVDGAIEQRKDWLRQELKEKL